MGRAAPQFHREETPVARRAQGSRTTPEKVTASAIGAASAAERLGTASTRGLTTPKRSLTAPRGFGAAVVFRVEWLPCPARSAPIDELGGLAVPSSCGRFGELIQACQTGLCYQLPVIPRDRVPRVPKPGLCGGRHSDSFRKGANTASVRNDLLMRFHRSAVCIMHS